MDELLAHLPMAVVVLVLGLVFKKPFFEWLNRVRLKSGDTVLEMASQAEQQVNASKGNQISGDRLLTTSSATSTAVVVVPPSVVPSAVTDAARAVTLRNVGLSPLVIEHEESIRRDLLNLPEDEQRDLLIRNLAISQLQTNAEQIYRLIFGSQLNLLEHLNLYGPTPKQKLLDQFYDPAAVKYPAVYVKISKDEFLHFLQTNTLITIVGENDGQYAITVKGKSFLEWIVTQGILAQKPF